MYETGDKAALEEDPDIHNCGFFGMVSSLTFSHAIENSAGAVTRFLL